MFKNHQRKSHYKVQVLKCHFQRISIKWKILLKVRMWSASVWRVQWSRWAALFHILMIDVLSVEPVQPKLFFARFSQCISHIPGYNKGRCWNFFDVKLCAKSFFFVLSGDRDDLQPKWRCQNDVRNYLGIEQYNFYWHLIEAWSLKCIKWTVVFFFLEWEQS